MRAWLFVVLCLGCSGSGDSRSDASSGPGDVGLAPLVVSVSPDAGTTNVERGVRIDAVFSVNMDPATIDATTMTC